MVQIARHGAFARVRERKPHILPMVEKAWAKYPTWDLHDRYDIAIAMADCTTEQDWLDLREHRLYRKFTALVDGWTRKTFERKGWNRELLREGA